MKDRLILGDCLEVLKTLPPRSVDLVFGSPPYEDCRTYGIDFKLKGQEWVDWMVEVYRSCLLRCNGLVAFVVQGRTRKFKWSCTPALLITDLHRAGICIREPLYYHRSGIPGSGGPDDMRHDVEYVIRATNGGQLSWSNNVACGKPPKCKPGGAPTHRLQNGKRVRIAPGKGKAVKRGTNRGLNPQCENYKVGTETVEEQPYIPPKIANPGNVIQCSGGHLGSKLAHENEAPFPEKLAEFFIKSFCKPGGVVLDPFSGSGTTAAVAKKNGRHYIGIDCRQSQIELAERRLKEVKEVEEVGEIAWMK